MDNWNRESEFTEEAEEKDRNRKIRMQELEDQLQDLERAENEMAAEDTQDYRWIQQRMEDCTGEDRSLIALMEERMDMLHRLDQDREEYIYKQREKIEKEKESLQEERSDFS